MGRPKKKVEAAQEVVQLNEEVKEELPVPMVGVELIKKEPEVVVYVYGQEAKRFHLADLRIYCEMNRWHYQAVLDVIEKPYLSYIDGVEFKLEK